MHCQVANALYGIGRVLTGLGQYVEAQLAHQRALTIRSALLEIHHNDIAKSHIALADISLARGDLSGARLALERVLSRQLDNIYITIHPPSHHTHLNTTSGTGPSPSPSAVTSGVKKTLTPLATPPSAPSGGGVQSPTRSPTAMAVRALALDVRHYPLSPLNPSLHRLNPSKPS